MARISTRKTAPVIHFESPRRGTSTFGGMLPAATLSEPGSALVGLAWRRFVATFSLVAWSVAVGSSEESVSKLPVFTVTAAPHWRQNLASGTNSAPQPVHWKTPIRKSKYAGHLLWASTSAKGCREGHRCGVRAFCGTQAAAPKVSSHRQF